MYEEQIHAYFDDPKARETLISAISRLVAVKSVRGEAQPGMPSLTTFQSMLSFVIVYA